MAAPDFRVSLGRPGTFQRGCSFFLLTPLREGEDFGFSGEDESPMRILYGVVGEGMGHATRSRVILEELTREHEVHIVASGRATAYLQQRFSSVHQIWGYTIAYKGNSVRNWLTVVQNLKGAVR